jgi:hypothetical protein
VKNGVAKTILMSRVIRAKRLEPLHFTDPALFGLRLEGQGGKFVALWSRGAGVRDFVVSSQASGTLRACDFLFTLCFSERVR